MAQHPPVVRPPRITSRGAATRARIVEAAADLVYLNGVGGTSLDDIMEVSATSKSQLYHYFADKDALIREVILLQTRRTLANQEPDLHHLDSLAGLRRWRDAMVGRSRTAGGVGGCPVGSLASELAEQSEDTRKLLEHCFETWESYLVAGLSAMHERGELAPGASPPDLATAVLAAVQGGLLLTQATRTTRPLELALDMAIDHVAAHMA
jgi:TetR/AcrR family transcriptional repressor of nem operon